MKILIVEDQREIAKTLAASLKTEYFEVDVAFDGERGSFLGRNNCYDVIILDLVLPKKDGKRVCQEIRQKKPKVSIIVISVKSEIPSKVELLDMGADDYLTKPFSLEELLARIRALIRRSGSLEEEIYRVGDLMIDCKRHIFQKNNEDLHLTRKEFMLMELLMRRKGETISRGILMEKIWDINADPFSNTIEAHIGSLRKKISNKKLIKSVAGVGYKLEE